MRYAGIIYDDTAAAPGLCLSFYVQGCPIHCPGCHNPQTWDENGGYEFTMDTIDNILNGLRKNGIQRSLAILGGEPLAPNNIFLTALVIKTVKEQMPNINIWIWSGYDMEEIINKTHSNSHLQFILKNINTLITGPFIQAKRNIAIPYRGSTNQKIFCFDFERKIWYNKENKMEEYNLND